MARKAYALLAVVGIVVSLSPLVTMYLVHLLQRGERRVVYEETIVGVRFKPEDYFDRVSQREFVVTRPLSWAAHTYLTWNGYGDFDYTFPAYEPDFALLSLYLRYMSCDALREHPVYKELLSDLFYEAHDFLIENDCHRLRKFLFDTESASWYAALTLVGYFNRLYMEGIREPYYVWILVRFDPDAMRVKFYNAASARELGELKRDLRRVVAEHPRVAVGIITHYPIWYKLFEELSKNGTYIVALYARDRSGVEWPLDQRIKSEIFSAVHESLRDLEFMYAIWVLLEGGEISTAYIEYCDFIRKGNIPCTERPEYFYPQSFT